MANLVITVIAIALVAIAALMGAYYGGSAYMNNQSAANASVVLNEATQLAAAWNAYRGDNLDQEPATLNKLLTSNLVANDGYMAQIPMNPPAMGNVVATQISVAANGAGTHYFAYADLGHSNAISLTDTIFMACAHIIKTAIGQPAFTALAAVPSAAYGSIYNSAGGNGTFGCAVSTGAAPATLAGSGTIPPAGDYVFEYVLQ